MTNFILLYTHNHLHIHNHLTSEDVNLDQRVRIYLLIKCIKTNHYQRFNKKRALFSVSKGEVGLPGPAGKTGPVGPIVCTKRCYCIIIIIINLYITFVYQCRYDAIRFDVKITAFCF